MMYVRYLPSMRNVEDQLAERGIDISHETVRFWCTVWPDVRRELRERRVAHMRGYPQWSGCPLLTAPQCAKVAMFVASHGMERASMEAATIIGLDLAKRSFQTHGALGSVWIQREFMTAAAILIMAAKL
jgi:hypothetical protein